MISEYNICRIYIKVKILRQITGFRRLGFGREKACEIDARKLAYRRDAEHHDERKGQRQKRFENIFSLCFHCFLPPFCFYALFFTAVPFYASVVLYASLAEFSQSYISTLSEKHNILSIIDGF